MANYYSEIALTERTWNGVLEVHYLDIVIDGQPLSEIPEIAELDTVSCFDFFDLNAARRSLLSLTGEDSGADVLLYVCPLCGDIGCGAVQIQVARSRDDFEWHGFAYVNNTDDPRALPIGPFRFKAEPYLKVMQGVLAHLSDGQFEYGERL